MVHGPPRARLWPMDVFSYCFGVVVGEEGGYTADTEDPGNWTGGRVGVGRCAGTKYGISAASFPALTIVALSLAQAQAIYRGRYWDAVRGDALPPPLALLVFDCAVNNGVSRAVHGLQAAAGCAVDGVLGPATLEAVAAAHARDANALMSEFQARRLVFMAGLPSWQTFGLGWARRLCALPLLALPLFGANASSTGV